MQKETEHQAAGVAGRGRKPIAAVAVAAVAAIVLLTPCVLAAASQTIYPRTSVAGIAVGGMSRSEALDTLTRELPQAYAEKSLPVTVEGGEAGDEAGGVYEISLGEIGVRADAQQAAEAAWSAGRSGNFFTSGVAYAQGLLLGRTVVPELTFDKAAVEREVERIAAAADIPVTECSWRIDGEKLYVTKPKSGYLMDQGSLIEMVEAAVGEYDLSGVSCTLEEKAPVSVSMKEVYDDAHREASNAYYDKAAGAVKDGESGVDFDAGQAQTQMDEAAPGEEFAVPVTLTEPDISKEEMNRYLFRDRLGSCTTNVSGSSNRKHNVSLAAKSCNGVVLNPGETFSYNETLGQRTAANGYRTAGAYVGGKTVEEYGGGICQISSTLYLAVLRSNLEIVSRTNHMFYPGYIPYGMDATVSWGGPDFKFRNNTDYPIKLSVTYSGGKATCTIYGTNLSGQSVKMEYNILSSTPYETVEKEDKSLAPGTRKQKQNGYTGYKVATYRCVYDKNGKLVSRTLEANSTYKSRNQIILVGPAQENTSGTGVDQETETTPSVPETGGGETAAPETPAPDDTAGQTTADGSQTADPAL